MSNPLVSIITITRNRADLLPRCINSIQNQTYTNFEHIIVDGASTDDTDKVVASYNDARIRYIKTDYAHSGHMDCWQIAFAEVKGKYLCFLDDDDEYLPTKIEKQIGLIESLSEDYGLVYCWMTYYDSKTGKSIRIHNPQLKGDVSLNVVEKPAVSGTPTFMIKTEAFFKLGGWVNPEETGVGSDWAFGARFCQHYKVDFIPESLIKVYVNHGHTRMSNAGDYYHEAEKKNIKFHNYFLSTYSDIFKRYPQKGWCHYYGLAYSNLKIGNIKEGLAFYLKLLRYKPSIPHFLLPVRVFLLQIKGFFSGKD